MKSLFLYRGRLDKAVLAMFVAINIMVLFNAIFHDPIVGYDSFDHLNYIKTMPYQLPTEVDTREYYSPPLPYLFPSIVHKLCGLFTDFDCIFVAGKTAQFINVLLSLGITVVFLRISELLKPNDRWYKLSALLLLGVETVYYRTFSQVRGEPYVAFFVTCLIYLVLILIKDRQTLKPAFGIMLGVVMGLLILSSQWGILSFPAIIVLFLTICFHQKSIDLKLTKILGLAFIVAFFVGGWFYVHLRLSYGSFTPFSLESNGFSLSNQPLSFYRHTGLKNFEIFKKPIRRNFDNQFIPIMYSDTWGDYWGYFTFIKLKSPYGENENSGEIGPYLGRVNFVSLLPSIIMFFGILLGVFSSVRAFISKNVDTETYFLLFITVALVTSFLALWELP